MSTDTDPSDYTGATFDRHLARIAAGAYDDAQDVRKAMMNRVRDVVRKKNEGIPFDVVEDEKEDQDFESKYDDDNLPELIIEMRAEDKLTEREFEYLEKMLETYNSAVSIENQYEDVMAIAQAEPIYSEWLTHVYGVSSVLTAKLLHRFGYCEKFDRVSQLWKYTGYAPNQKRRRGEKLGYSPEAKTLAWNVADCIIKQGDKSLYREHFYDPYKDKQVRRMKESMCNYCGKTTVEHYSPEGSMDHYCTEEQAQEVTLQDFALPPELQTPEGDSNATPPWRQGHADDRARRYLAKKFLKTYWYFSRKFAGLETPDEWVITHGGHAKTTETFENPEYQLRALQHRAQSD